MAALLSIDGRNSCFTVKHSFQKTLQSFFLNDVFAVFFELAEDSLLLFCQFRFEKNKALWLCRKIVWIQPILFSVLIKLFFKANFHFQLHVNRHRPLLSFIRAHTLIHSNAHTVFPPPPIVQTAPCSYGTAEMGRNQAVVLLRTVYHDHMFSVHKESTLQHTAAGVKAMRTKLCLLSLFTLALTNNIKYLNWNSSCFIKQSDLISHYLPLTPFFRGTALSLLK